MTRGINMMYNYIKLPDETQFAYSGILDDNTIEVTVERPVDWGFNSARCTLPAFTWSDIDGFSSEEMADFDDFVHHNAPLIMRLAREVAKSIA